MVGNNSDHNCFIGYVLYERFIKMSWSGSNFYCIKCGSSLEEEFTPEEVLDMYDFDSTEEFEHYTKSEEYKHSYLYYQTFGNSSTYHCKNNNCQCSNYSSVVLFHPLGDIGHPAGDSLAFGIQSKIENDIFCFMCGNMVDKNKMCCTGKQCCFTFNHALDIIETPKIVFGLGFIK
jgi:hypothetical protein